MLKDIEAYTVIKKELQIKTKSELHEQLKMFGIGLIGVVGVVLVAFPPTSFIGATLLGASIWLACGGILSGFGKKVYGAVKGYWDRSHSEEKSAELKNKDIEKNSEVSSKPKIQQTYATHLREILPKHCDTTNDIQDKKVEPKIDIQINQSTNPQTTHVVVNDANMNVNVSTQDATQINLFIDAKGKDKKIIDTDHSDDGDNTISFSASAPS